MKKTKMPHNIKPMLATLVDKPFDKKEWYFEIKWDGYRAIAEIEKGNVNLYSRNFNSFNQHFLSIASELEKIDHQAILDGEVVVLDSDENPSFELIQNYQKDKKGTLVYYVFDLLYLDGYDLTSLPLKERKEILKKLIPKNGSIIYCDHIEERGTELFNELSKRGYEGIIAKDSMSSYQEGRRGPQWLKIKTHQRQEAIICGFTEPRGGRKYFGALILGVYNKGILTYVGHSGSGFDQKKLGDISKKLNPLIQKNSPFPVIPKTNMAVTWVKPQLVCEISFAEWTKDSIMRQPIFIDLRIDKKPQQVIKEVNMPTKKALESEEKIKKPKNPKIEILSPEDSQLKLTHLDKIYWPDEGYTKGDLLDYYREVTPYILPYLKDRPESLNRFPNGINHPSFFQKDMKDVPSWIKTETIKHEHDDRLVHYFVVEDPDSLLYMVNLGCIEINPMGSRIQSLHYPDYMIIDLDPEDISFDKVVEAARVLYDILKKLGIPSVCKTSGGRGLHVYVPMGAKYTNEQVTQFSKLMGHLANKEIPEITSLEHSPSKRQKKVYYDYLRNPFGQTAAAVYCVRPRPGAPVSTPLKWTEVKPGLDPKDFTIKTVMKRFKKVGDLFKPILGPGIDLEACIKKLEKE